MNNKTRDKYQQLVSTVKSPPATSTAEARPCDEGSLSGAIDVAKMNIIVSILPGPRHKIFAAAQAANLDAAHTRLSTRSTATIAAEKAVALFRAGPR
jgi:phosphate acetyltransferase